MKKIYALILFVFCPLFIFGIDLASKVTVITTCCPSKIYPRTNFLHIGQYGLVKNIPEFESLPKIIICDAAKNPTDKETFDKYKKNLKKLSKHPHFKNTQFIFCEEWQSPSGMMKEAMKHVKTEYVYIHQDDLQLLLPIDMQGLVEAMNNDHNIKVVRFNAGINSTDKSDLCDLNIDDYSEGLTSFPLLRTNGWCDKDHLARKDYYEDFVFPKIGDKKGTIEKIMMIEAWIAYDNNPDEYINTFGTFLYGTFNEGPFIHQLDKYGTRLQNK